MVRRKSVSTVAAIMALAASGLSTAAGAAEVTLRVITLSVVLGIVALIGHGALSPAFVQERGLGEDDLVLRGDAVCTGCHNEDWPYPVLLIGRTKHGTTADRRTPTCTSCHGESTSHIEEPSELRKPDRYFSKVSTTPVSERNGACLSCHQGGMRMLWSGSTHESQDLACTSCHQVHTDHDKVRSKRDQPGVCFKCHKLERVQFNKPSRHPLKEGKVICSDCHNPHGSAGPKLMKRDTVVDTCYQCHAEKRGPFIWNHQPVTENCALCHNPHGTNVANLLKQRPPLLCQQCHEPSGHRGAVPTFTDVGSNTRGRNITLARACLNCHTNIHGGNNPALGGRTFRR